MMLSNLLPNKQYFTIGEVSETLELKTHVLRYWEREFSELSPIRRRKRRYYQHKDIECILKIKELLYDKGYSIRGAQTLLEDIESKSPVDLKARERRSSAPPSPSPAVEPCLDQNLIIEKIDSITDTLRQIVDQAENTI